MPARVIKLASPHRVGYGSAERCALRVQRYKSHRSHPQTSHSVPHPERQVTASKSVKASTIPCDGVETWTGMPDLQPFQSGNKVLDSLRLALFSPPS